MSGDSRHHGFHGPKCWVITAGVGLVLGVLLSLVAPANYPDALPHAESPRHHAEPANEHAETDEPVGDVGLAHGELPAPIRIASAGEEGFTASAQPEHAPDGRARTDDHPEHLEHHGDEDGHPADNHADDHAGSGGHGAHGPSPVIPLWLVVPFALLLLSIALMPFVNERFWHHHYPDFAFLLGGVIIAYYMLAFGEAGYLPGESYGQHKMLHTGLEYYSFIALIGGLFVASGGVLVDVRGRGGPLLNTLLLGFGAVAANVLGTTGASVLLIRPFMRINRDRLRPMHVVMFIFIVSNCGGALTPIGDPPLYLGFLKGIPFEWTLVHLVPMWAVCIGMLLAIFFALDTMISKRHPFQTAEEAESARASVRVKGASGMICLALIIAGVFIDPLLKTHAGIQGYPIGATFQIAVAVAAYFLADREIHKANDFNFEPVKEVGLLFVGIFATMAPALGFLAAHGSALGLNTPTAYYFGTGSLSAVLDNAPTYLNFLQVSFGDQDINPESVHAYLETTTGIHELTAISLGAVFFGAMTYIGNGPNFMVRAIAEAGGLKMPSFFGYLFRSIAVLLPVLLVIWVIFIR